jgi:membrane associated rhomboid family serine protease
MYGSIEPCTGLLMVATVVTSAVVFANRAFEPRFIFEPESILARKEYYRLVTSAFLHADWQHLIVNMLSLYFFGGAVEYALGRPLFLLVYFGAIVGGSLLSLYVHRHHEYRAYGASGGVCGILFAYILLFPGASIYAFPLPVPIPAWLYAALYLTYSFWGMKTGRGNVGHDAHLGGAIVGLLLAAAFEPAAVQRNLLVFLLVLGVALLVLLYLWFNPLFLPLKALLSGGAKLPRRRSAPTPLRPRAEQVKVDELLEKISREGLHSLTDAERALLEDVSAKHRRRGESHKPQSDLVL